MQFSIKFFIYNINIMIFKYKLGIRPIPRIAMFNTKNDEIFSEISSYMKNFFSINSLQQLDTQHIHMWNPGAYLVYDDETLRITNIAFSDFSNLIFLFRYINKELWCELEDCMIEIFKLESNNFVDELLLD